MKQTKINAEIVGHSLSPQGDELISVLATFPRSILAEINTHRMLSKNTSSSRAIPFNKMIEAIINNPFIPIAWQKDHKGMQGNQYITNIFAIKYLEKLWLEARDNAITKAEELNGIHGIALEHLTDFDYEETIGITKQITNRLLEPFMWTTMLITGSKEGWENFFRLRCPQYMDERTINRDGSMQFYKSKKDYMIHANTSEYEDFDEWSDIDWLKLNKGQAEIHIMDLAEKIWDARNESTPRQLKPGEWHIPFRDKIDSFGIEPVIKTTNINNNFIPVYVKVATAMAARTSYTVIGEEKSINIETLVGLHDRLLSQEPPHSSPMEHCAKAMTDEEYYSFIKGQVPTGTDDSGIYNMEYYPKGFSTGFEGTNSKNGNKFGWVYNLKGFIPYRYFIDNKINL